jgi:hypothetical protein
MPRPAVRDELRRVVAFRLGLVGWPNVAPHDVALVEATIARLRTVHASDEKALASVLAAAPDAELTERTESNSGVSQTRRSGDTFAPVPELSDEALPLETPGRYEVLREIGTGGLGRVLSVRDLATAREVALKELHGEARGHESDTHQSMTNAARFLREARITAQLEHPGIVPVYEVGRRRDGSLYYTMRRIEGRTLADAIVDAGTLEVRLRLLPALLTVAQAVAYAHERQVLHRDIKPQNVMLGRYGEAWLLDWGLARVKPAARESRKLPQAAPDITGARGTALGTAVGTPAYMSPEQARGATDELDERTDVWGLGGLLFELLTGRSPFVGKTALEVLSRIVNERVDAPRLLEPDAPADLCAICEKALSPEPKDRYADASAFAADVQAWLERRTVSAKRYSSFERARLFVQRHPVAVSAVGLGVAAVLLVGGTALRTVHAQRDEARRLAREVFVTSVEALANGPLRGEAVATMTKRAREVLPAEGGLELTNDEATSLARACAELTSLAVRAGRLEDARVADEACAVTTARFEGPETASSLTAKAWCLNARLVRLEASGEPAAAVTTAGTALLDGGSAWRDDARWVRAEVALAEVAARGARSTGDPATAEALTTLTMARSEALVLLAPNEAWPRVRLAEALRQRQLETWVFGKEETAVRLGDRAVEWLDGLPPPRQDASVRAALAQVLHQQAMVLQWAGKSAKADEVLARARPLAELVAAAEPDAVQRRVDLADVYLRSGEPRKTVEVLQGLASQELEGQVLATLAVAALLADQDEVLVEHRLDLEASDDPQAHWVMALWLVQQGKFKDAADTLRAWAGRAAKAPVVWPLGRFDVLPLRSPAEVAAPLQAFIACQESALRRGVEDVSCFETLASGLEAAVPPP